MKIVLDIVIVLLFPTFVLAKSDLTGKWITECNVSGKHSFKATLTFQNNKENIDFKLFEDTTCKEHSLSVSYIASYITGAKFGEGKKFNSTPEKVQMTVHLQKVIDQFNRAETEDGCGFKDWKLNVARDVSGKFCRPFKMPTVGKTVYDIYKLNLNSLVFGGLPLKWDMVDPTVRPKQLSKTEFWITKEK